MTNCPLAASRGAQLPGARHPRVPSGGIAWVLLLLAIVVACPRPAAADFPDLLGESPPDSTGVPPTGSENLDSLNVGRGADVAYIRLEDQVALLALGDHARTGVAGMARPASLGSPGWGRLPVSFDGIPMGQGVVHWDNAAWFPIRGIQRFGLSGGAAAIIAGEGAGRSVSVESFSGPARPSSVVSLLGGSFGHRLAELDFARQFGPVAFHADVADFGHDGFGVIGRTDASRGFARLDFSALGFDTRVGIGLAAGSMEAGGGALDSGTELTDESSFTLRLVRPMRLGRLELSLLSESSRLEIESLTGESFRLSRGRRWGEAAATWNWDELEGRLAVFGSTETREGADLDDARFSGGGLLLAGAWRWSPGWQLEGAVRFRRTEPADVEIEPGLTLTHALGTGGRWWLDASRSSGFPGLLLHLDQPLANLARTQELLLRLESLEIPERHLRLAIGGETGDALRVGAELSAVHTDNRQPWLSLAAGAPLETGGEGSWNGDARLTCRWRARDDLEFGVAAGAAAFDEALEPYRPQGRADGWTRLTRSYFQRDLNLTIELAGHLLGSRTNPVGEVYPTLLSVDGNLTARIRTLTLFLRLENMAGLYIESDLRDPDFPVALPGYSTKLGATLRLVD